MCNVVYRVLAETYYGPYIGTFGAYIGEPFYSFEDAEHYIEELLNKYDATFKLYGFDNDHPDSRWAVNGKVWVSGRDTLFITKTRSS